MAVESHRNVSAGDLNVPTLVPNFGRHLAVISEGNRIQARCQMLRDLDPVDDAVLWEFVAVTAGTTSDLVQIHTSQEREAQTGGLCTLHQHHSSMAD